MKTYRLARTPAACIPTNTIHAPPRPRPRSPRSTSSLGQGTTRILIAKSTPEQLDKLWKIEPDNVPEHIMVNAVISMDKAISRADDLPPWNLRVSESRRLIHSIRRLTDDLNNLQQRKRKLLISVQIAPHSA